MRATATESCHAPETRRLYAADWTDFSLWCETAERISRQALPAAAETVAAYLESLAPTHGYGAPARRLAAIADRHARAGLAAPVLPPQTTALLRRLRAAPRAARPQPSAAQLTRLARACAGDRSGQRDRALLLLLAAGLSRATVISLDAEDLRWTAVGMELTVRRGPGAAALGAVAFARHPEAPLCPVRALEDWLRASETAFGPVFRKVDRWGNVEHARLGTDAVRRILQRMRGRTKARAAA